jgi:type IX secretion system PorP/SprF family membrane protein
MKLKNLILLISTVYFSLGMAQEIPFSNMTANALYLNPACTGVINRDVRIGSYYRSQGKGISAQPYTTMGLQADMAIYPNRDKNDFFGFGVNFYKHDEGLAKLVQTNLNISASYTKGLSETLSDFVTIGFQGGISQRTLDVRNLKWDTQWDPGRNIWNKTYLGETYDIKNKDVYDMSVGLLYNKKISRNFKFNTGFSINHIFRPGIGMNNDPYGPSIVANEQDKLQRKFTVHGSAEIATSDNATTMLIPTFLYSQKITQKLFMLGLDLRFLKGSDSKFTDYVKQTSVSFGLYYRYGDAVIPHVRMDYKDFSFYMAYDVTVSKLTAVNKSSGAFEFALLWNFKTSISSKNKPRVFKFVQ